MTNTRFDLGRGADFVRAAENLAPRNRAPAAAGHRAKRPYMEMV